MTAKVTAKVTAPTKAKRGKRRARVRTATRAAPATRRRAAGRRTTADAEAARLTRRDWINGTIRRLAQDSVAALRIDELADALGVTKGSFYWHFRNREDLLDAVLESWRSLMVTRVKELIGPADAPPLARLRNLLHLALTPHPDAPGGPFELTLRDWARRDARVAKLVREVDTERVAFLEELYRGAGLDSHRARVYALAQMSFIIGSNTIPADRTGNADAQRRRVAEMLFIPDALAGDRNRS